MSLIAPARLHFGFLDALPLFRDFDITPSKMKLWKWPQWTLFYSIILLLSSLISYILPFISKNLAIKYFSEIAIITIITYQLYHLGLSAPNARKPFHTIEIYQLYHLFCN